MEYKRKRLVNEIWRAIEHQRHNVIPIWGKMGDGKSNLALQLVHKIKHKSGLPIEDCDDSACWEPILTEHLIFPFPTFMKRLDDAVLGGWNREAMRPNKFLMILDWDDIAVYFHRAFIQYQHPWVKKFLARYNYIRPYLGTVLCTTPSRDFIPGQLLSYNTHDVMTLKRGKADFDTIKILRKFKGGGRQTMQKFYDEASVTWDKLPPDIEKWYLEIRHNNAVRAITNPEEMFPYDMPAKKDEVEAKALEIAQKILAETGISESESGSAFERISTADTIPRP